MKTPYCRYDEWKIDDQSYVWANSKEKPFTVRKRFAEYSCMRNYDRNPCRTCHVEKTESPWSDFKIGDLKFNSWVWISDGGLETYFANIRWDPESIPTNFTPLLTMTLDINIFYYMYSYKYNFSIIEWELEWISIVMITSNIDQTMITCIALHQLS